MIAVIFSSLKKTLNTVEQEKYTNFNNNLENIAQQIPGYIKQESVRDEQGVGISISYWENRESAIQFKKHPLHLEAQKMGKDVFYQWYKVEIVELLHDYSFNTAK